MRRIILAACAVMLLHAAPSMAAECTNLALVANGGTASASSEQNTARTARGLNNGIRENENGSYHWFDGTDSVWPDWAQIEWRSAQSIDRIVLQGSMFYGNGYEGIPYRTQNRLRVQYWDGSAWVDVSSDVEGQDNPIVDWTSPWNVADGTEFKRFDLQNADLDDEDPRAVRGLRPLVDARRDRGLRQRRRLRRAAADLMREPGRRRRHGDRLLGPLQRPLPALGPHRRLPLLGRDDGLLERRHQRRLARLGPDRVGQTDRDRQDRRAHPAGADRLPGRRDHAQEEPASSTGTPPPPRGSTSSAEAARTTRSSTGPARSAPPTAARRRPST